MLFESVAARDVTLLILVLWPTPTTSFCLRTPPLQIRIVETDGGYRPRNKKSFISENSRRLWLFPGSVRGFSGKTPGKCRENCWKNFPESRNATNFRISGTRKGKPAGNLGSTLPGPCPHLPCGVFFEIDSSSLLEFFWLSDSEKKKRLKRLFLFLLRDSKMTKECLSECQKSLLSHLAGQEVIFLVTLEVLCRERRGRFLVSV